VAFALYGHFGTCGSEEGPAYYSGHAQQGLLASTHQEEKA